MAYLLTLLLALGLTAVGALPAAAADPVADPTAALSIQKQANVTTVTPGQTFNYTIQVQCTAGTVNGCVNAEMVDPLPEYLTANGTPTVAGSTSNPQVEVGPPVSVTFHDDLGGGQQGLAPGNIIVITIPVVVDPNIPVDASGKPLVNTATVTADNANPKEDSATVTPNVPATLGAKTTKTVTPGGAVANPGTPLTTTLTGQNTSNVPVDTMVVQDPVDPTATPNPFQYLGVTGLGAVTMPAGAETVQASVYVNGAWVDGPVGPPAALPPGVDPADITGVRWTFTSTTGTGIAPGATAGVGIDMAQRANVADLTGPITITNEANTTVTADGDSAVSPPATGTYKIPPSAISVAAGKTFDPDTVRAGDSSTATLTATNTSAAPIASLTITEPKTGTPNPFTDGLTFDGIGSDAAGAGIVWPDGATGATITYTGPGCPGTPLTATAPNTLPAPPAGCTVTGFSVTYTGEISPGAEATVPFTVTTAADQDPEELTRTNTIEVDGARDGATATDDATASITSIEDRLAVTTGKTLLPSQIPAYPGEIVTATLTGRVEPFPASTTDATQIIVQDPATIPDPNAWYDSFNPQSIVATPVPGCSTMAVQYTTDGTTWTDIPGMANIGPGIFNGVIPQDVSEAAIGIRFVYTANPAGGSCTGGFPPGTSVKPNLAYSLDRPLNDTTGSPITNCAASSATNGTLDAHSQPACDDVTLLPVDLGTIDPIDKHWDKDLLNARSQQQSGVTLSWSTAGFNALGRVDITDTASPATTPLADSVFDTFDLVRIDPITPALDPLLTYDQVSKVQLYVLPAGSTDPAAGSWIDAPGDPCPAACDGTFPGYTLSAAQRQVTIGFRLSYIESPTRAERLGAPGAPPVGSGVAASTGNNRHIHPVFQLRDELRSDPDIPITADRLYNVAGENGVIDNTVRADPYLHADDTTPILTRTDHDTIALVDVPVTTQATKSWTGGPLGVPEAGVPQDQYPTGRVTLTGANTTPAKIDSLTIADPTGGTDPFDTFNLARITQISTPASIGASDVVVTLTRTPGGATTYTRAQALALTEAQLVDVTGISVKYTGRIDAAVGTTVPKATVQFDARLRTASRADSTPPQAGQTIDNAVTVTASDLDNYPNVTPNTATANATGDITLAAQGIGVVAGKSFSPDTITEPSHGPSTVTLTGQPSGPSRTVQMVLTDTSETFWNAYDLVSLGNVAFVNPINRVQVDAFTGGTWSVAGGTPVLTGGSWQVGTPTAGPALALPAGVSPADVQGLRFTFTKADDSNWENPANPKQPISFVVERRDTLHTGGPVLPDLAQNPPSPGETAPGVATDTVTADVTSSDQHADGSKLTATDSTTAQIHYHHSRNAVTVAKAPNGQPEPPGSPFTYTLTVTNSGDTDITDPVITDRLPTDAQGPLVSLAEDPKYAFTITGGTGMPTDPADVTIDATATQLKFTFPSGSHIPVGATYTITFQMLTRAGLPANTPFTNSFGVTGDRPWDACSNGGSNAVDPATGECQASATNTVLSAGAVSVSKAVKAQGSDTLGVAQDPTAPALPTCTADAEGFYVRPCDPIAEPGGAIDWRLRFTNVGNRPLDRILGIDRLPAPGDTLATATLPRGSQWRPLLTGTRPTLAGPAAAFTVYYTTATDWSTCDDPRAADGSLLCTALNWQEWPAGQPLPVAADTVTGLQVEILPTTPLAPTASEDVFVAMTAPAWSPADTPNTQAESPSSTFAYNSVGTAARWVTDAGTGYTLTTEPPRVGVGLAHGAIRLDKVVTGDAADKFAPGTFPVTLVCTSAGQQVPLGDAADLTLTPGTPLTVYDLPYHATCTLTERDNGQTSEVSTTATVQQGVTDVETVTLTNTYEFASLAVTKTLDSAAVDQDGTPVAYGPFEIGVACTYLGHEVYADGYDADHPMQTAFDAGQAVTFTELPAGARCVVTETDDKGAASTTITTTPGGGDANTTDGTTAPIVLTPDSAGTNTAEVINHFNVGSVQIHKVVTGDVADVYGAGPFTVAMTCVLDDPSGTRTVWDGTVVLGGDQPLTKTIDDLATGAQCSFAETDNGGASTVSIDPTEPITVGTGEQPATVTVTNSFDPAQLQIDKSVTGDAAKYAAETFRAEVTCSANGAVLPGFPITVTVVPGTPTVVDTLAGATCTVTETDSGQATSVSYDPADPNDADTSGGVHITADGPNVVTITNEYRSGGLQIVKQLDGPGAPIAAGPFTFDVTCSFDGRSGVFTDTVTLSRNGSAAVFTSPAITGLPVGAVCEVTETGTGGADHTPPAATVVIPDVDAAGTAQVVAAGFVNAFSAASLQVTKVLAGDDAAAHAQDVFTIDVTCQVQIADTRATVYQGSVKLRGGQTVPVTDGAGKTVLLPAGAHCWGAEPDTGGASSSAVDHGSWDDAVVAQVAGELQTLTLTVTNTFNAPPAPPGPNPPAPTPPAPAPPGTLPNTGVPVLSQLVIMAILIGAGLLLVVGSGITITGSRRRREQR